jgi:sugar phosphate isomerase/epimerase
MNLSISTLAWSDLPLRQMAQRVSSHGLTGVEIAPTSIWPESPNIPEGDLLSTRRMLEDHGLGVSGLQSLLFGRPDLQLFDRRCWPDLCRHLSAVLRVAGQLGADVAVFGSPKNRRRGDLPMHAAMQAAAEFFTGLIPELEDNEVVLTLEPNAPEYGADFLTGYRDCVELADLIGSEWVQPQVDTGCLTMVGEDAVEQAVFRLPAHVHVSAPGLGLPQADRFYERLAAELRKLEYQQWVVLEMLPVTPVVESVDRGLDWLRATFGDPA